MLKNREIASIRHAYAKKELRKSSVNKNPIEQLTLWLKEAIDTQIIEPNAMILSTVGDDSEPSSRVVLLKGIHDNRLQFFTNYLSAKAKDLENNPAASLLFFWREMGRQIRITGSVTKTTKEESERYFSTRPYESKIAASISKQSSVVPDKKFLQNEFEKMKKKYPSDVPPPKFWGGYNFMPVKFEFWQGRENRMHDRILYEKKENVWEIKRLSP